MTISLKKIKHYEILKPIGKGGMGEVYLAQDTILDRKVAIKFLPEESQKDPKARERFVREAKSAASLDHPFICKIYEAGEVDGKAFIVMEFVEGEDLGERLKNDPLPLRDSLNVALEIVDALEKAHKNNIIHRDLKPANIMLTPQGHVKVMDFGLAKKVLPRGEDAITKTITQASITEQGTIAGTISYMSPEQARGDEVDQRSDIFALGIILQEMLTGDHPFSKTSAIETLSSILRDPAPPTNIKPKAVNPVLNPILRKALAKDLSDRYQNISELAADLRNVQRVSIGKIRIPYRQLGILAAGLAILVLLIFTIIRFIPSLTVSSSEQGVKPISVLIADFQNLTGDPVFDGALEQTLGIGLEGASFISVYDRTQARNLAGQLAPDSEGQLNAQVAQLVSRREGINVVISASIEQSGEGFAINVTAVDPVSTDKVFEASRTIATKAEVLKAADQIAAQLRTDLGGMPAESTQELSMETFTASSLEAMQLYARAQELAALGRDDEALLEYLKAIDKDPNLGRAYAGMAVVYRNRGDIEEAKKSYEKAMALLDRMTERERYRTRGGYYFINRNYKKAIEEYSALREKYPNDSAGYNNLPLAYFYARNMERAFEEGKLAVEAYPGAITPLYNQVWYSIGAGKFAIAEQELQKVMEINPDFAEAYVLRAIIQLAQGRTSEMVESYEHIISFGPYGASWASIGLADFALYEGRMNDARKILEEGITSDLKNELKAFATHKRTILAQTLLLQGNKELAVEFAENAVAESKKESILFTAAQIYVESGMEERALNLAQELDNLLQPEPQAYAKMIQGEIKMKKGEITEAINLFQQAQDLVDTWLGHFELGHAYLEANAFTEAHSEYELCLERLGEVTAVFLDDFPSFRYLPSVYYYLGRAQEGLNSPAAKESYQKFLKIKENADPNNALVTDARKRLNSQ